MSFAAAPSTGAMRQADRPGTGMSSHNIRFVDLIFRSQTAAIGEIVDIRPGEGNGPPAAVTMQVSQSLGQSLTGRLVINFREHAHGPQVEIVKGQACLLFVTELRGDTSTLFGGGDVGVWPRLKPDWLFSQGHVQPLKTVVRIVAKLLEVDKMDTYEDRATALSTSPFTDNSLGQIAALQYATIPERWPAGQIQGDVDLRTTRSLLTAQTLLLNQPLDIYACLSLSDLLRDLPLSVAFPKWIDWLTYPDVALRDDAYASLKTEAERWTEEDFGFDARSSEQQLQAAQDRWKKWYENQRAGLLREEVRPLLTELRSEIMLRRRAADLLLRVISGQDQKFQADSSQEERSAAVKGWEAWWRKLQLELKP